MGLQAYEFGLRPQDQFEVIQYFELNQSHLDVLNRLFTPLIGSKAIGLYHFMTQFVERHRTSSHYLSHYVFMNELKLNLLEFRQQMDLLEAIGLVKTFVKHNKEESQFVYELIQPPTAHLFFNDPMLSIFLYSEVDHKRFQELKHYFEYQQKDLSAFKQTTRTFTDVFKVPTTKVDIDTSDIPINQSYQGMDLSDETFDFDMLSQMLGKHFISKEIITKEAKQLIIQLATLYGLTPDGMKHVILKSITSGQQLSFEDMRKEARSYYLIEHDNRMPKLQVNTTNEAKSQTQKEDFNPQDNLEDWFELLEQTSPIDMLASWSESEPTISQKAMIEELIDREKMSFGVINVLLQFVMLKEDMKLPKAYIFEIASNWKKKDIKTAKEAYNYAKKVNQPKQDHGNYQSGKNSAYHRQRKLISKEKTPKWLAERELANKTNNDNEQNDQKLEQDRQEFLARLSKKWEEDDN
ncbi:replication initiation and membrane attachment family protein [Staphylococcus simiae]|uniref:replication initiation and membrane attachment family protein n=1 Tax=Staphylococcus simiae TaxID=308354 RepID=UPI001A95C095|nr:replication initiation and membrane attachment family protein [Staphylococcus simiae]MBO1198483.1 replication initiation and membrane attachment family protein [Staphylococcus simiae]MBO1201577.1 replication initiation and membrane attachment family protein [Staphylococcus simiae]MBO1204325.1 replication initiation and membrane attachment family protein [Staphylococcus simiae]MBO1210474.1 replication initiation and membrane attachment family protein [Staphylococcus simiae]MBO1229972.1 repli